MTCSCSCALLYSITTFIPLFHGISYPSFIWKSAGFLYCMSAGGMMHHALFFFLLLFVKMSWIFYVLLVRK